jgi:3-polyprenyl-4-hydroxybenzoate decarboxylase
MSETFRTFLEEMETTQEGGFIRIDKEVDSRYEAAAIVKKLELACKVPLLDRLPSHLRRPKGSGKGDHHFFFRVGSE